jgi:hypothetical protein
VQVRRRTWVSSDAILAPLARVVTIVAGAVVGATGALGQGHSLQNCNKCEPTLQLTVSTAPSRYSCPLGAAGCGALFSGGATRRRLRGLATMKAVQLALQLASHRDTEDAYRAKRRSGVHPAVVKNTHWWSLCAVEMFRRKAPASPAESTNVVGIFGSQVQVRSGQDPTSGMVRPVIGWSMGGRVFAEPPKRVVRKEGLGAVGVANAGSAIEARALLLTPRAAERSALWRTIISWLKSKDHDWLLAMRRARAQTRLIRTAGTMVPEATEVPTMAGEQAAVCVCGSACMRGGARRVGGPPPGISFRADASTPPVLHFER